MSEAAPLVELEDVHLVFGGGILAPVWALRGLSLRVPTGSVMGLLGPNGAGKTTAISCMLGLPRLLVRTMDNVGLLFPEPDAIVPWPHLGYGTSEGAPAAEWRWPVAHFCVVLVFWLVLGVWRYQRHDFGSRTAVK